VGLAGLAGCSGDGGGGDGNGTTGDGGGGGGGTTQLNFGGSTNTSASFQAAIPWAEQLGQNADPSVEISVQSTGGLDANVRQVSGGNFDLASTTTPNFQAAAIGERPFQQEHTGLRPLFTNQVYPFPIGLTTTETGIDYMEDLTGSAVSTGPPGSSTHTYFSLYAGVNEIPMSDIDTRRIAAGDAFRQLGEGQISAVVTGAVNTVLGPTTQEFIQRNDNAKLVVPKDPQRTERLARAGSILDLGYEQGGVMFDFPLDTFQHAHENSAVADQDAYTTVAGTNTLFATDDMNNEIARTITETTIERSQQLADATALWAGFNERTDYYTTALPVADAEAQPWHPGAAEALEEAGYWNDDLPVAGE
jgi:TRAP-type uncharacterized transport system substrate-binding protein